MISICIGILKSTFLKYGDDVVCVWNMDSLSRFAKHPGVVFFLLNLCVCLFPLLLLLGLHAASLAGKRVHAFGVPEESAEEGAGEEDALPGLQHDRLVRARPPPPRRGV